MSDVHLGKPHAQADKLIAFLDQVDAKTIYLVGDFIDFLYIKRRMHWPKTHAQVVATLLARAEAGASVTYLPGNHDHVFRNSQSLTFGAVNFANSVEHQTADGRRYLVIHGDQYDRVLKHAAWLEPIGDRLYDLTLTVNARLNALGNKLRFGPVRFSAAVKKLVKRVVNYMSHFEMAIVSELRAKNLDGVICGHVHHAELRDMQGYLYVNTGDWVESCTAVVEHFDGTLEILEWAQIDPNRANASARGATPCVS